MSHGYLCQNSPKWRAKWEIFVQRVLLNDCFGQYQEYSSFLSEKIFLVHFNWQKWIEQSQQSGLLIVTVGFYGWFRN